MDKTISELFAGCEKCNAARVLSPLENRLPCRETTSPEQDCGALRAAMALLWDEPVRQQLKQEFIKLSGSSCCGQLKGKLCVTHIELAQKLLRDFQQVKHTGKPRLLLLGDSIRMNYQNTVSELLKDEFDVVFPTENCRFAKYMLNELERYILAAGKPDIVHWNAGAWDSAVVNPEDGMFTPVEEYCRYLSRIGRELLKIRPKVIFATTTPVLPGSVNQHLEYIQSRNEAAVPLMKKMGIVIDDLYSFVLPRRKELLKDDRIHLNPAGAEAVGRAVADSVRRTWNAV